MSTRSSITAKTSTGKFKSIYCHFDGYPSHVGATLLKFYSEQAIIDALMNLGDLSCLYDSPEKPDGHSYENPVSGFCVAYGRDRGESDTEAGEGDTAAEALRNGPGSQEYDYLWDGQCWSLGGVALAEVVENDKDD